MSNFKYLTNGSLDDPEGTGVTVSVVSCCPEGKQLSGLVLGSTGEFYEGYQAKEISKEEYLIWKDRIAMPDMITYFPGVFPGIGVVSKATYLKFQQIDAAAVEAKQAERKKLTAEFGELLGLRPELAAAAVELLAKLRV